MICEKTFFGKPFWENLFRFLKNNEVWFNLAKIDQKKHSNSIIPTSIKYIQLCHPCEIIYYEPQA